MTGGGAGQQKGTQGDRGDRETRATNVSVSKQLRTHSQASAGIITGILHPGIQTLILSGLHQIWEGNPCYSWE